MGSVTTVALLERKPSISRDLFTRYWRDVHGVMAARIPGFHSYTQHHVTPLSPGAEPFEGIAVVTFKNEGERQGLVTSTMTSHIHRDEHNVFRRALLYNLTPGATQIEVDGKPQKLRFLVVPAGADAAAVAEAVRQPGMVSLITYDLATGDPSAWNETDLDDGGAGRRFVSLMQVGFRDLPSANVAIASAQLLGAAAYRCDETHAMVENGRATPVGLRGLDAVRAIQEAGADNQFDPAVERALYGM